MCPGKQLNKVLLLIKCVGCAGTTLEAKTLPPVPHSSSGTKAAQCEPPSLRKGTTQKYSHQKGERFGSVKAPQQQPETTCTLLRCTSRHLLSRSLRVSPA